MCSTLQWRALLESARDIPQDSLEVRSCSRVLALIDAPQTLCGASWDSWVAISQHPAPSPSAGKAHGTHSHWIYQALQMALLRRILSRQSSLRPLKFFHLGDTSLPLSEGESWVKAEGGEKGLLQRLALHKHSVHICGGQFEGSSQILPLSVTCLKFLP